MATVPCMSHKCLQYISFSYYSSHLHHAAPPVMLRTSLSSFASLRMTKDASRVLGVLRGPRAGRTCNLLAVKMLCKSCNSDTPLHVGYRGCVYSVSYWVSKVSKTRPNAVVANSALNHVGTVGYGVSI